MTGGIWGVSDSTGGCSGIDWQTARDKALDAVAKGRKVRMYRCYPFGWRRPDGTLIRWRDRT